MFFVRMRVSAYASLFSKWLRKKEQFIGFSFKFLKGVYSIRETFVFQTEIYTFRIFIRILCYFFLLSLPWGSVCYFFFSHEEHEDMPLSW